MARPDAPGPLRPCQTGTANRAPMSVDDAALIYQDLRRFRVPPGFRGRSLLTVALWRMMQASLFAWSPPPLHGWRCWLLRLFGGRIGRGVRISSTARIAYPWKLTIGDHAWIGDQTELYSLDGINIGTHAVISQRSYLCAAGHTVDQTSFSYKTGPIRPGLDRHGRHGGARRDNWDRRGARRTLVGIP